MRSLSTLSQRRIFEQTFYGFRGSVQKSAFGVKKPLAFVCETSTAIELPRSREVITVCTRIVQKYPE